MTSKKSKSSASSASGQNPDSECSCHCLISREDAGLSPLEDVFLDLARLHCASVAMSDDRAHQAARALAGSRLGIEAGVPYFQAVVRLMETLRRDRFGAFSFLPARCGVVCQDELDLVSLLRACRFSDPGIAETRAQVVLQGADGTSVIAAARHVIRVGRCASAPMTAPLAVLPLEPTPGAPPRVLH